MASPPARRKRFIPLENNPDVMSSLVHKLGLSDDLGFHDVFSIDDPELLNFVPRPAHALLLVFPVSDSYKKFRAQEDADRAEYQGSGAQEPVIWYKQTIGNACGLIGLLHGLSNGQAKSYIKPGSDLAHLVEEAVSLKPAERANLLVESQALEDAHQAAAAKGDTAAPDAEDSVDLHYVCFVKAQDNHLWELDGSRKGPLDRGRLGVDDDVLCQQALDLGVRSFLKREADGGAEELRFSLVALAPSWD